ncbi:serine/threonine protein kinase [Streptomyces mobaraensis NBRC 13819 = DSM 40847]|uniref:non-specific serine/threonine protein kinase n=1 Tax=Streptomyces mobaraensis (strain ATCC 29032 / DSM 40847 / JCM 4168 / NBRC 13819 / NCIMB 11159 / IPCR 16-22) TaxID=1223523 RepID=M3C6S1_STRM1|nr:serine/threonine-protein kinase [Streptomyces mobaraensis]EME99636.1 serine/threonine protein kinase [Streptomyces mobaraensis NBRC 13819 = DSM 40847]
MSESVSGAPGGVPGPASGRLLAGRYRLLRRIGRGGMGTVWLAEDELLGRRVAVKQLHVPHGLDEEDLATLYERTRREARSAARISHPNVVVVHDVVEDDEGLPCIVMEHVPSKTLGEVLKQGPLAPEEAARIGRGMIAALRAAHAADVLHRDVKPGNVLLGDDGRVVLTDFGIAHLAGNSTLTKTGEMVGSIDYIAPERVRGARPGPASDLWALGATLYEAVEGRTPYQRPTPVETAYAIAVDPLEPPLRAGSLTRLIETLLSRDPDLRPPADLVEQILREPAAEPGTARHPAPGADGFERSEATTAVTPPHAAPAAEPSAPVPGTVPAPDATPASAPVPAPDPVPVADLAPAPGRRPTAPTAVAPAQPAPPAPAFVSAPTSASAGRPVTERPSGGRRRIVKWVAVAVVPGIVAAVAAFFLLPGEKKDDAAPPAPEHSSSSPAPTPTPSSPPPVPPGYRLVTEKDLGVAFPVPKGWSRKEKSAVEVDYIDPTGLVDLKVNVLDLANPDPLNHWQDVEQQVRTKVDAYRRLRMQATAYRGDPAAVWEFVFKGRVREFRAIDLGFGRAGGDEYAVYLSAPSADWDRHRPVFDAVRDGFRVLPR